LFEYPDDDLGHRFIVSGGEVVDIDEQVSPRPLDLSISHRIAPWEREYRKELRKQMEEQEKVETMLYQLQDCEQALIALQMKQDELIDQVMPDEVKQAIAEIHAEFDPRMSIAAANVENIKQVIRIEILKLGRTVENEFYQVQWKKGRSGGFDTKMLEGMARLIPQLNDARRPDSEPTVSFNPKR
jgi:hypothetical protein